MSAEQVMEMLNQALAEFEDQPVQTLKEQAERFATAIRDEIERHAPGEHHRVEHEGTIINHFTDRRGRVWLKLDTEKEKRGRRFMSRRLAKRWARRQYGKSFFCLSVTPVMPAEYIPITITVVPQDA